MWPNSDSAHALSRQLNLNALELGGVGSCLLPWRVGLEVEARHVLERLADDSLARIAPVVAGLAADAALQPHLAHHLQRRLVGYAHVLLGAQAHRHLAVAAAVRGAREYFRHGLPQLGPGRPLGAGEHIIIRRARQSGAF